MLISDNLTKEKKDNNVSKKSIVLVTITLPGK